MKRAKAVEAERDALAESRDRARQERNAWMSRARAATAEARGSASIAQRVPAPPAKRPSETAPPPPATHGDRAMSPGEDAPTAPDAHAGAAPPGEEPTARIEPTEDESDGGRELQPTEAFTAADLADASDEPAPPPSERRTIQIGERPGPLARAPMVDEGLRGSREVWTPRLIAVVALVALVVVVLLLVLLAF